MRILTRDSCLNYMDHWITTETLVWITWTIESQTRCYMCL